MDGLLLELKGITKLFPGVKALDDVNLQVRRGEIHALVGENGAGKSTLMNIISGVYPHGTYQGQIIYDGRPCSFSGIADSERQGIVIIHQELSLIPCLSIAENIFLGNERGRSYAIDWTGTCTRAGELLEEVGLHESPTTLVENLGVGKMQLVELAKALSRDARLLILDEPTSSLNETESRALLDLLLRLKKQGLTSIIISHKLNEIAYVADRITVLRDGRTIETLDRQTDAISRPRIIRAMVGRELSERYPERRTTPSDEIRMSVDNWIVHNPANPQKKVVDNVSFTLRKGEVLGIAGLMGSGRTELFMSLFGKSYGTAISGTVTINGEKVTLNNVSEAIRHGLAYVTEDRKEYGLILMNSVRMNTSLANLEDVSDKYGVIVSEKEDRVAHDYVKELSIKTPSVEQSTGTLSGGNQQKVLLSRWMFTQPDILILDEPTRGIDVGAKYEIYCIINSLVEQGKSVVLISSELPEVLGMSDRIYVMNEGRFTGEFNGKEATPEKMMECMVRSQDRGRI